MLNYIEMSSMYNDVNYKIIYFGVLLTVRVINVSEQMPQVHLHILECGPWVVNRRLR